MPLLFYGPGGGGGGGNGYRYPNGNVIDPAIKNGNGETVELTWGDPADVFVGGNALSEWKGTVVVRNSDHKPLSVDDGETVCESTQRDEYKNSPLIVDSGDPGCYYGIFPYTKDYVVNVSEDNVLKLMGTIEETSWADIAFYSENGLAQDIWSVGDRKTVSLSGNYNEYVTLRIAGFNHNQLTDGSGLAGITFISEEAFILSKLYQYLSRPAWINTTLKPALNAVKASMPDELQAVLKSVKLPYVHTTDYTVKIDEENEIFAPSLAELGLYGKKGSCGRENEGTIYELFLNASYPDDFKKECNGSPVEWWTRSVNFTSNSSAYGVTITETGTVNSRAPNVDLRSCIMFCV